MVLTDDIDAQVAETGISDVKWTDGAPLIDPELTVEIQGAMQSIGYVKRALLNLGFGRWYLGHFKKRIWKSPLPFYAWRCKNCGKITFGYPHGYKNYLFCNNCLNESLPLASGLT